MSDLVDAVRLCIRKVVVVVMVVDVMVGLWKKMLSLGFWAGPLMGLVSR